MKILVISGSRSDRNGLSFLVGQINSTSRHWAMLVRTMLQTPHNWDGVVTNAGTILQSSSEWLRRPFGELPDFAVVGGDRYETLASAFACSIAGVPIVHIAGGDQTLGSADDRYRWAITALTSIHCATNERAFSKLATHSVAGSSVAGSSFYMTGSPAVDMIRYTLNQKEGLSTRARICELLGLKSEALVVVCVHPNTVANDPLLEFREVRDALDQLRWRFGLVWLGANQDAGGIELNRMAAEFCRDFPNAAFVENLGPQEYYSLLRNACLMVGNSSAAFYELPEFQLPAINVGDRQLGRLTPKNVFLVEALAADIKAEIEHVMNRVGSFVLCENPYGDGNACARIIEALEANAWRCSSETLRQDHG